MVSFNNLLDMIRYSIVKQGDRELHLVPELLRQSMLEGCTGGNELSGGVALFQPAGPVFIAGKRATVTCFKTNHFHMYRSFHAPSCYQRSLIDTDPAIAGRNMNSRTKGNQSKDYECGIK